jgi:hypothetical protein
MCLRQIAVSFYEYSLSKQFNPVSREIPQKCKYGSIFEESITGADNTIFCITLSLCAFNTQALTNNIIIKPVFFIAVYFYLLILNQNNYFPHIE